MTNVPENRNRAQNGLDKVGYKSPPKKHQFKPGQSGNPRGRPKGSKNKLRGNAGVLNALITEEGSRIVTVQDGGKEIPMTLARTAVRKLILQAAKGDTRSAGLYLGMLKTADDEIKEETHEIIKKAIQYKRDNEDYIENRKFYGDKFKMPLPHPEHVEIDWETLEVSINGPGDKKELANWKMKINIIANMEVEMMIISEEHWGSSCEDFTAEEFENFRKHEREEYDFISEWHEKFRDLIPEYDPLWLEYGPGYKRAWIDYYFYHGPNPRASHRKVMDFNIDNLKSTEEFPITLETRTCIKAHFVKRDRFRKFMRGYLRWSMGDTWHRRFERPNLKRRNIEHDSADYDGLHEHFDVDGVEGEQVYKMFEAMEQFWEDNFAETSERM